jgi:glucokinase
MDLIADIGGTNSRCALLSDDGRIVATQNYVNADFDGVEAVLHGFLEDTGPGAQPSRAALAVAAPVRGNSVRMVNIGWGFSQDRLRLDLALESLTVVNDFEAVAWSLLSLPGGGVEKIGAGDALEGAARAVLGPGTGLGMAAIVPAGDGWSAVTGEGGHITLAAMTEQEFAVVSLIGAGKGHCAAEDLLSGPGLGRIYGALAKLEGKTVAPASPAEIAAAAEEGDALAVAAREMLFSMLGTVAGNLALIVSAFGGVYIAGGIVPRYLAAFAASGFRERFEDKGDYRDYLRAIPTFVITESQPAFAGLRRLLGRG